MRLRFSAEAREHIAAIHNYVSQRNTVAAAKVVGRIR
jgi:toxin ParE1/3/4